MSSQAAAEYAIAELKAGERGGFCPRGAVKQLWQSRDFATIVAGPADTGKTWGSLQYADALLWKYAGAQGVMARKVYSWLVSSALQTYLRIIGKDSPIKAYGGERPEWFDYPNGSRLWLAGLDNPGKALSSERDFIYINQTEELVLADFETMTTRCSGRGRTMPYTRIFGDANPGPPKHWIKVGEQEGKIRVFESRHEDNPDLYTEDGQITPEGRRRIGILDALTGVRLQRLRYGRWVQAEGVVYDGWNAALHHIDPTRWDRRNRKRTIAGVDWGYTGPGVIGAWDLDGDRRLYEVREVYQTKKTIDWWIEKARAMKAELGIDTFVCDPSEPGFIQQFNNAGLNAVPGFNDIKLGIQNVAQRLKVSGDGRPRLFVLNNAIAERDEELAKASQPASLTEEIDLYVWPKAVDGKPIKEVPVDANNHSMDQMRYVAAYVDDLANAAPWGDEDVKRIGSYNDRD